MKVELFSNYIAAVQKQFNEWVEKHPDVKIEYIKYSTCCTSSGSVFHQIAVFYTEGVKI